MKVERGVRRAPVSFTELTLPSLIAVAILALAGCSAGAGSGGSGNNITVAITNKVTTVQAGTAAISFSATVQNDTSNKGVTWSLTASGSNCAPTCGALSAATTSSVTYTPPASAGASPNKLPTLTATSVAKTNKSDSDTFTISPALVVTITNIVSTVNSGTEPFVVNATVQNDSTNSGVSWMLTANGAACSPACGSLSGATTTSVTYAPPSSVPASQPTLTATSVHDTLVSAFDSFVIQKAPIAVTISNKISTANANGGSIDFAATVQNDPSNRGVSWTLTANGAPCAATCGTLSSHSFSAIYTPPTSVPPSPDNVPTLTATSVADNTKSDVDPFTIEASTAVSVTINRVSSVLAGGSGVNFSANIQNDPSSTPSVNWTLTSGGSACSPACGSLSNVAPTSVTYVPPSGSVASLQITATSAYQPSESASDAFTVTSTVSNNCGSTGGDESLLNGQYALLLQGFWSGGGGTPMLTVASFSANGSGGISGGEEDVNDTISPQHLKFDSTSGHSLYTIGTDHRGCLQLTNTGGTTAVFRFAVGGINSGIASTGRVIEFDDNSDTGAGSRGSGILRLQNTNAFTLSQLAPQYAFGVDGWGQNGAQYPHFAMAGSFSASNGDLANGVIDFNTGGILGTDSTGGTGMIGSVSASTGRATASFDGFDWTVYIVNATQFFIIGSDPLSVDVVSAGRAIATSDSFTASTLSGNYILHTNGNTSNASSVDLELLTMAPGGAQTGTLSGTVYSDGGGNGAATTSLSNVAYNINAASGRVALGNPSNNLPVLYVTTPTDGISAFVVGVNADAQGGVIEFQPSQTYSTASAAGTYAFGSEDPGDNTVYNDAGSATISSSGSATGTVDSSTATGLTPNVPFNATVTISNSNGTGNLGSQTVAIINGTKIFYIDESAGVIVIAEQ